MDSSIIDPKDSSNNWADQSANHIKPSYRDVISAKVLFKGCVYVWTSFMDFFLVKSR